MCVIYEQSGTWFRTNEALDTDLDGIGNNADRDDDNDWYSDVHEVAVGSDSLNAGSVPSMIYPLESVYKGSVISEQTAPL